MSPAYMMLHPWELKARDGARAWICRTLLVPVLWMLFLPSVRATEIDRLIASVNGVVITEGDLELVMGLDSVLSSGGMRAATLPRKETVERLIDQELMRQEVRSFGMVEVDEDRVESRIQALNDALGDQGGLHALLKKIGLREEELRDRIRFEISIIQFVDFRFRPFVSVSQEEVYEYYEGRLAPQLRGAGISVPPLSQVSAKIEVILREEKVNTVLDQWIKEVRRSSRIEYFDDES